ncbi:hypothetical protein DFH08DRAFT_934680 [Mycena albidolilacea]|uniref:Uncharacterized protein n=1 Tax=Mycena albidolilacea TaxID=1033008 RepID=A0AAD7A9A7_9AGAR|nr:hypothetical protein DFH08DRAFT_934680 [Mycena albidolilacea]
MNNPGHLSRIFSEARETSIQGSLVARRNLKPSKGSGRGEFGRRGQWPRTITSQKSCRQTNRKGIEFLDTTVAKEEEKPVSEQPGTRPSRSRVLRVSLETQSNSSKFRQDPTRPELVLPHAVCGDSKNLLRQRPGSWVARLCDLGRRRRKEAAIFREALGKVVARSTLHCGSIANSPVDSTVGEGFPCFVELLKLVVRINQRLHTNRDVTTTVTRLEPPRAAAASGFSPSQISSQLFRMSSWKANQKDLQYPTQMRSIPDEQFARNYVVSYYGEAFGLLDEVKKVLDLHQRAPRALKHGISHTAGESQQVLHPRSSRRRRRREVRLFCMDHDETTLSPVSFTTARNSMVVGIYVYLASQILHIYTQPPHHFSASKTVTHVHFREPRPPLGPAGRF